MFATALALALSTAPLPPPPPLVVGQRCRTVVRMEPEVPDTKKKSAIKVLRSIAGDVIVRKSSSGRGSQTVSTRVAERVRGYNPNQQNQEVQQQVCEPDNPSGETK